LPWRRQRHPDHFARHPAARDLRRAELRLPPRVVGAPARMAQAAAPLLFGLLLDHMGSSILIVSSALSLAALGTLLLLNKKPAPE
jgi:hypothetical protein